MALLQGTRLTYRDLHIIWKKIYFLYLYIHTVMERCVCVHVYFLFFPHLQLAKLHNVFSSRVNWLHF